MSVVTNIMIAFSICEQENEDSDYEHYVAIDSLNQWLIEGNFGALACLDCHAGGGRAMESPVFGGAFNYFSVDAFTHTVKGCDWRYPDEVQIFVQEDNDDIFRIITI